ncbi:MAG: gliding motility-associated C-terminal domain-containing protein [Flavobacteriales bacterium]
MGQCVVINEIMINGAGSCDGNCMPNTEEWIELYNTCNTPTDVSCFVFSDGDFTVTIPSGTIIPANGYLTIGSNNSGFVPDINLSSCNCTGGSAGGIGVFTNGSEQAILLSNTGALVNGVVWGSGQFPVSITSPSISGCSPINFNYNNGSLFESLPTGGGQGQSIARQCDGSSQWAAVTAGSETPDASNGESAQIDFDVSATIICPGNCINFSDLTVGNVSTWSWTFEGATTPTSSQQNPNNICYPTAGNYDVTLTITNSCGSSSLTMPNFVQVGSNLTPSISAQGSTNLCANGFVVLQTSSTGSLQWLFNNNPIPGATNSTYNATQVGDYSLEVNENGCSGVSNIVTLTSSISASITLLGNADLCAGETTTLQANGTGTYQWYNGSTLLVNETNSTYSASVSGNFNCVITSNGCSATSNSIAINVSPLPTGSIATTDTQICEPASTLISLSGTYASFTWYNQVGPLTSTTDQLVVTSSGEYYAILANSAGCEYTTNSIVIDAVPLPSGSISAAETLLCEGENTTITLVGNYTSLVWHNDSGALSEVSNQLVVNQESNYYATVTNAAGCEINTNSIAVSVDPLPTGSISTPDNELCPQESTVITLTGTYDTHVWRNDSGMLTESSNQLNVTTAGNYFVTLYNAAGCETNTNTVSISEIAITNPTIASSNGNSLCPNESSVLSVAVIYSQYAWFEGTTNLNESTNSLNINSPGTYTVSVTTNEGCEIEGDITISAAAVPDASISSSTTLPTCNDFVTLSGAATGTYEWYYEGNILNGESGNNIDADQEGSYYFVITASSGCTSQSAPIDVLFLDGIETEITPSAPTACQGETVTLNLTGTFDNVLWSTDESTLTIGITQSDEYTVEVVDSQGCIGRDTLTYTFSPLPELSTEPTVESNCVDGAVIEAIGDGIITWQENEFIAHGSSAIALVNPTATTTFTAIAELDGCFSYSNTMVLVDCSSIYAPNAFSPNGDGINDVFEIKGTGIFDYELIIFDKWGGIIFQSVDPKQAWTGGIDGYFVPDGVYTYTLKALDIDGVPLIGNGLYFGSVLVMR